MKNSFHTERFIIRVFLYFWFLIRAYLRDPLDFSWTLNANIKLNYCVCKNRSNFDRYQENYPPENPPPPSSQSISLQKTVHEKIAPYETPPMNIPPCDKSPQTFAPEKIAPSENYPPWSPPRRTYKSYKWKEKQN